MTPLVVTESCPRCGDARLALRKNRRDGSWFVGCEDYPSCRFTEAYLAREQRLAARIAELEGTSAARPLERELKLLARRFHPDLHRNAAWATEVCGALLELRERVAGRVP